MEIKDAIPKMTTPENLTEVKVENHNKSYSRFLVPGLILTFLSIINIKDNLAGKVDSWIVYFTVSVALLFLILFFKGWINHQKYLLKSKLVECIKLKVTTIENNVIRGSNGIEEFPLDFSLIKTITTDIKAKKAYLQISGMTDEPEIILILPKMN